MKILSHPGTGCVSLLLILLGAGLMIALSHPVFGMLSLISGFSLFISKSAAADEREAVRSHHQQPI